MNKLWFVPVFEIQRILQNVSDPFKCCQILADIFRLNTLSMVMEAGSGHLGTCFSSMDILTWLWIKEMHNPNKGGDLFFSSKGHDAPALYSILIGLKKLPHENSHQLRRLGGLPGHPDVETPNIITNTGSLGMGISKARGMAIANRLSGCVSRIFVLCGDGELQEGQFWESLQSVANGGFSEITIIVDSNTIQSDTWVAHTSDLGNLEEKLESFGWSVETCDGHNFSELRDAFKKFASVSDKPHILIAETVKGCGVSFMEGSHGFDDDGLYAFHSGAPKLEEYEVAAEELMNCINIQLMEIDERLINLSMTTIPTQSVTKCPERLVSAYSDELLVIGKERENIIVLDADLVKDTGALPFKNNFPDRFVECGIAEQDMVSVAGGLALSGKLPIVHSFACFLSTRANEQIYNNATEKTKIIYVGCLAGLIPAAPGHSHQSVRDISCLGAIPGLTIFEPSCEREARMALRFAVEQNHESTYLRMVSVPCEVPYKLPTEYTLTRGQGVFVRDGTDVVIIAYGPVMLTEAFKAAEILEQYFQLSVAVMNFPWLNYVNEISLLRDIENFKNVFVVDDHYIKQGLGELISSTFAKIRDFPTVYLRGLKEIPVCGGANEVLHYHGMDDHSLVKWINT